MHIFTVNIGNRVEKYKKKNQLIEYRRKKNKRGILLNPYNKNKTRTEMRKKNGEILTRQAPEYPCKHTKIHTPEKESNKYRKIIHKHKKKIRA